MKTSWVEYSEITHNDNRKASLVSLVHDNILQKGYCGALAIPMVL